MLKLLIKNWKERHPKTPSKAPSEDPLLCTDLAKTQLDHEFSVNRLNPIYEESASASNQQQPPEASRKDSSEQNASNNLSPDDNDSSDSRPSLQFPPPPAIPPNENSNDPVLEGSNKPPDPEQTLPKYIYSSPAEELQSPVTVKESISSRQQKTSNDGKDEQEKLDYEKAIRELDSSIAAHSTAEEDAEAAAAKEETNRQLRKLKFLSKLGWTPKGERICTPEKIERVDQVLGDRVRQKASESAHPRIEFGFQEKPAEDESTPAGDGNSSFLHGGFKRTPDVIRKPNVKTDERKSSDEESDPQRGKTEHLSKFIESVAEKKGLTSVTKEEKKPEKSTEIPPVKESTVAANQSQVVEESPVIQENPVVKNDPVPKQSAVAEKTIKTKESPDKENMAPYRAHHGLRVHDDFVSDTSRRSTSSRSMPEGGSCETDIIISKRRDPRAIDRPGLSTSEDSGITRGDQVNSDGQTSEGNLVPEVLKSDSSDPADSKSTAPASSHGILHDSTNSTRKAASAHHQNNRVQKRCSVCRKASHYKKRCAKRRPSHAHCRPSDGSVPSNGSVTDLNSEYVWMHNRCGRRCPTKRSSISCMEQCSDKNYENFYNPIYRPCEYICNYGYKKDPSRCELRDQYTMHPGWTDTPIAPRSRFSWNGEAACTCGHHHPMMFNKRRVQFADKGCSLNSSFRSVPNENEGSDVVKNPAGLDDSKALANGSLKEPLPDGKGHGPMLMENGGIYGENGGILPWDVEEWQTFMREKNLRRRRKRALYMGLMALSLVVFVGVTVSLGLAYLRKKF